MPDFKITIKGRLIDQVSVNLAEIKIGRSADNDIILPNQSVSRHHAQIFKSAGQHLVSAFNSENPVLVNGDLCTQSVALVEDDVIQVGKYLITITQLDRRPDDFTEDARTQMLSLEHLEHYGAHSTDSTESRSSNAQPITRIQTQQRLAQQLKIYQVILVISVALNLYLISR